VQTKKSMGNNSEPLESFRATDSIRRIHMKKKNEKKKKKKKKKHAHIVGDRLLVHLEPHLLPQRVGQRRLAGADQPGNTNENLVACHLPALQPLERLIGGTHFAEKYEFFGGKKKKKKSSKKLAGKIEQKKIVKNEKKNIVNAISQQYNWIGCQPLHLGANASGTISNGTGAWINKNVFFSKKGERKKKKISPKIAFLFFRVIMSARVSRAKKKKKKKKIK
jgi:hypothetical protein